MEALKGIQYVIDESGEKITVLIDLKEHRELWEDLYDMLIAEQRRDEPRESMEEVKKRLRQLGKLGEDA